MNLLQKLFDFKKAYSMLFALFMSLEGFTQLRITPKFSIGITAGLTQNYEFMKRYRNSYQINKEKSIDSRIHKNFGLFAEYSNNKNVNINLQVKYLRIVQNQLQDANGTIIYKPALSAYECLNLSLYYDYYLKYRWSVSLGVCHTFKVFHAINILNIPAGVPAHSLYTYDNVNGVTAKTAYHWSRLGIEGGFMYPLNPISRSESTWFYVPTAFLQLKYRLFKSKLIRKKDKANNL